MKHLFIIIITAGVLLLPCAAKADWSDDFSGTSMSGIWAGMDTGGSGDLSQNGGVSGVLNFTAGGGADDWASYNSNFSFGLVNSFYARTDFDFNWAGSAGSQAGIMLKLSGFRGTDDPHYKAMLCAGYIDGQEKFAMGYGPNAECMELFDRDFNTGWFGVAYDSGDDVLYAGIFNTGGTTPVYGGSIENFSDIVNGSGGESRIGFSLTGWANYVSIGQGEAALDNFNAAAAPEPVSTVLFLLGGAALITRRLRRK